MESDKNTNSTTANTTADSQNAQVAAAMAGQSPAEISAATIARMMGLVTATDLKLVNSKLDLMLGKLSALSTRVDKVVATLGQTPTGSDLERIDVQIGSLKSMIREMVGGITGAVAAAPSAGAKKAKAETSELPEMEEDPTSIEEEE